MTVDSHAPPPSDRGPQLPRGRHRLTAAFVSANQRSRILDAVAQVCAQRGYKAMTVEDIVSCAGLSRRTFYDLFSGKQECFLVAYDEFSERLVASIDAALAATPERSWQRGIDAAVSALLGLLAAEPDRARLITVEVLVAGDAARAHRDRLLERCAALLDPLAAELPLGAEQRKLLGYAVIGGAAGALYDHIISEGPGRLPQMRAPLVYCLLVPYLGHEQALAAAGIAADPSSCDQGAQPPVTRASPE